MDTFHNQDLFKKEFPNHRNTILC